jgi:hypothetical protein
MTRINVGIPVRMLSDKHLIAEHREIKRIPNHLRKHGEKCLNDIPHRFTLGKGHVKFFLDKGMYTYGRYIRIYKECISRGFKVTDYRAAWDIYFELPYKHMNLFKDLQLGGWEGSLVQGRINERLNK